MKLGNYSAQYDILQKTLIQGIEKNKTKRLSLFFVDVFLPRPLGTTLIIHAFFR